MDGVQSIFAQLKAGRVSAPAVPTEVGALYESGDPKDTGVLDESWMDMPLADLMEAELDVVLKGVKGGKLMVEINGKSYGYTSKDDILTPEELEEKVAGIMKHSKGRALAWLRKNAETKDSYRKKKEQNESEDGQEGKGKESLNEGEMVIITCADCGTVLSSLDEAEEGCPACGSDNLDEKTVKVVREGKVTKKNVTTKKHRLTAAQKAALAKARKKAHTPSAEKSRAKSNRVRSKKGMNESETVTCPECGYEGSAEDFDEEGGCLVCPECDAHLDEKCDKE